MRKALFILFALLLGATFAPAQTNLFREAAVAVSSNRDGNPAEKMIDGGLDRNSAWMSNRWKRPPHIAEFNLPFYARLDSIVIHTGILPEEMRPEEKGKAAGFWCAKNFCLQYWDDANWTDIEGTSVTENRLDRVVFRFGKGITSFRFRFVCTDGEMIRIREVEGFGEPDLSMPRPSAVDIPRVVPVAPQRTDVNAILSAERTGASTMKYVGYNQGYLVPGSNAFLWWEYSGVNVARIWADLKTFVPAEAVPDFGPVENLQDFEAAKARFLQDPERNVPLDKMTQIASGFVPSTNSMVLKHALEMMRDLGIEVLIQSGIDRRWHDTSWQHRWDLWKRFYCQAFWCAKTGGVEKFALCNEPNHRNAGPMPLDSWIILSKIAADAADCALKDVNRLYSTSLKSRFVGPVTAGNNTNWWARAAAEQTTDYRGQKAGRDIIDLFSTHSYNLPAAGYKGRVQNIDRLLKENHPEGRAIPVIYTETGRWMNAYLIDKEETMDSPSLFTEWAGMYTENMLEGCYGMWAFKFANTISTTYPRGIKSGHHHQWKGRRFAEDAWENLALGRSVSASSGTGAASVTDGDKTTAWESHEEGSRSLEIDLGSMQPVGGLVLYSGTEGGEFTAPDRIRNYVIELRTPDGWKKIASEKNNKYAQCFYTVEPAMSGDRVRLAINDESASKVRELKVFGADTLSAAKESFDVGGAQRTAEVVRLFAKGFKGERPLLALGRDNDDPDLDMVASEDPATGNRYVWIVQRGAFDYDCRLDVSALGLGEGHPVVWETVGPQSYGEARIATVSGGKLDLSIGAQSVNLLTIAGKGQPRQIRPASFTSVRGGAGSDSKNPSVRLDSRNLKDNAVTYVSFDLKDAASCGRILLGVHGRTDAAGRPFRFHVYGFDGAVRSRGLKWSNAPRLDREESRIADFSDGLFLAGQMTMAPEAGWHWLDVTDAVRKHAGKTVSFCLVREVREPGDDCDKGVSALLSTNPEPVLKIW